MYSALHDLASYTNWQWQPEVNNTNGHEHGYWEYVGDMGPKQINRELKHLELRLKTMEEALRKADEIATEEYSILKQVYTDEQPTVANLKDLILSVRMALKEPEMEEE